MRKVSAQPVSAYKKSYSSIGSTWAAKIHTNEFWIQIYAIPKPSRLQAKRQKIPLLDWNVGVVGKQCIRLASC